MDVNEARNAMKTWVLSDLSAILKKLADDPAAPDDLRARARETVEEFNEYVGDRHRDDAALHFARGELLIKMARLLPSVVEVRTTPLGAKGPLEGEE
jgi:hypothetical protein